MNFNDSTGLGIVACPGGSKFASQVIYHLDWICKSRFGHRVDFLSRQYEMEKPDVQKEINKVDDFANSRVIPSGQVDIYREPNFLVKCKFTRFADGEFKAEIMESIRDKDIFIIQDIGNPEPVSYYNGAYNLSVNDHLMSLYVTIDAVLQSSPRRVSLVTPLYPYSRQHKRKGREGLTASSLGKMFEFMGVERIVTLDIHSKEIEHTFSKINLENLHASYQILKTLNEKIDLHNEDMVVLAPDTGSIDRNKFYAISLGKPLAMLYKERDYSKASRDARANNIIQMRLLGEVKGKTVLIPDDMLGTGGTLIKTMQMVRKLGAKRIICCVSLPLFSGKAIEYFDKCYKENLFEFVIGTNGVTLPQEILDREWFFSADVSKLFALSLYRIHHNLSIAALLDNRDVIQQMLKGINTEKDMERQP